MNINSDKIEVFQAENGALELLTDSELDTVWATQADMCLLFIKDQSVISRHINRIFNSGEVDKKSNMQKMHITNSDKPVAYYSLDIILAVGYKTNSVNAIRFRKWATRILKQHIQKGYTLNDKRLEQNKSKFVESLKDLKILTEGNKHIEAKDVLSLIEMFSDTFFALDSYDKNEYPKNGTNAEINASAEALSIDLKKLKIQLIKKGEATELFGQEKRKGSLKGIFNSVFQSVFGEDAYTTIEEKAAHLLYFIIKNHPFTDGNKRSGAFSFVWLLQKSDYGFQQRITPETLTTLTILIAESNPKDMDKMIGIIKLLLSFKN